MFNADIFDPGLLMNLSISARQMGEFLQESLVGFFFLLHIFQFNGKFWQPSQFRSVQERLLKRKIFTKVFFFFQPCETAAAESLRTGVVLLFFLPVRGKKQNTATI